jgi:hypothetical protein
LIRFLWTPEPLLKHIEADRPIIIIFQTIAPGNWPG